MKFPRSIRWKLQLWYGGLLLLLLAGFGFTAYQLESSRQLRQIDEELQRRLPILVESQRPVPGDRERRQFRLPPRHAYLFDQTDGEAFYYVVWLKHGDPVTRSATAPKEVVQPKAGDPPNRSRGDLRETFLFPGPGDCVLVGRSVASDRAGLRQFAWWLIAVGATVLAAGIAVGAWLIKKALRPIRTISAAAESISSGDLSRRIQAQDTDSELGQLAAVLNATFARLEAAFDRQARFTSDAAHELRTPLAVILLQAQNGLASDNLTEEQREAFAATQRSAQRMRDLVESLLLLARLDSGVADEARKPCRLDQVAAETLRLLQPLASRNGTALTADFSPASCLGNEHELGRVVTNLVANAILHNSSGVRVNVKTIVEESHATLVVSDNGKGIPAEDLPRLFERFYRVEKARTTSGGHMGLGLAITRAIVLAHGGTISAESKPGQGTAMTVRLPLASVDGLPG